MKRIGNGKELKNEGIYIYLLYALKLCITKKNKVFEYQKNIRKPRNVYIFTRKRKEEKKK